MTKSNGKLKTLEQSATAKRVNLAEWRASRLRDQTLPSGLQVKLRDVTMTDLMFTGKLPSAIVSMAKEGADGGGEIDLERITQNTQEFNVMLNALVELCLVEPKIGAQADDEHILLSELPADDKMAIFNWANRGAEELRPFREGEGEPVEAV